VAYADDVHLQGPPETAVEAFRLLVMQPLLGVSLVPLCNYLCVRRRFKNVGCSAGPRCAASLVPVV
jgi:hypothetical protein